jgi:hypothetical protein
MAWLLESFTPPMCMPNYFLDWAHQLMYLDDQLLIIISSSGMLLAILGMGAGPSMLWEKLKCYDGSTVICGGIAALLIIARPLLYLYLKIVRLAKNLFLRQKCFTNTGCACTSSVARKRAVIERWTENICQGKKSPIC